MDANDDKTYLVLTALEPETVYRQCLNRATGTSTSLISSETTSTSTMLVIIIY